MSKNSRFIAFRLHPNNEAEREALKVYDKLVKEGFAPREIFTDALNKIGNNKPEMFEGFSKQVTKPYLDDLLADFAAHLLREIRGMSISLAQREASDDIPLTDDEDKEYAKNLAAGYMARRKR